ncbi:MAG: tRNA preQ1(34) S-adenosylmethionine ribosyltransferase-isomerase QueA [Candidatus Cloacimonetes bacterium HGW-Cloacimonetes-1]|jgi:S-adenosylmethionine:tRNA ribosyltransferase-isomerase|nr:MAG: tRNA preQ1(34) S-adenosylmethionine ribosyltransferase-isomerase QueA [Candidatus Cloacimonetes bacterium HGW-Cloacimonetes-1]
MIDFDDINTYDYALDESLIAQFPLPERTSSRLMRIVRNTGTISHHVFSDIVEMIGPDDVLVVNSSKVFPARLYGFKENGSRIEVFLLHHLEADTWKCMVHPGKRLKKEQSLKFSDNLCGWIGGPDEEGFRNVTFTCLTDFWEEIYSIGHIPLPPYIDRPDTQKDCQTYQTVYASERGSVAAPTAGLHFSLDLMDKLRAKDVKIAEVVLHVGIGTFRPVKTEKISDHIMHSEHCSISVETASLINTAKAARNRIIAVGTTSVRTLESFFEEGQLQSGSKWTDIFIYPGKSFQVVDAMVTNYHLPKSTLLMLVSAFAGYDLMRSAYEIAIQERYRFFSYGDAMFIE